MIKEEIRGGWRKGSHDVDVNVAETACWHGNVVYGDLCVSLHLACLALRACFNPFLNVRCYLVPHKLLLH